MGPGVGVVMREVDGWDVMMMIVGGKRGVDVYV